MKSELNSVVPYVMAINDLSRLMRTFIQGALEDEDFAEKVRQAKGEEFLEGVRDAAASLRIACSPIFMAIMDIAENDLKELLGKAADEEADKVEAKVEESGLADAVELLKAFRPTGKGN